VLIDAAGRRRSPATLGGYLAGRAPRNKGMRYRRTHRAPSTEHRTPSTEEIIMVMRRAGQDRHGLRIRALIAVLWRAGAADLRSAGAQRNRHRRAPRIIARAPRQGNKRREAGMDLFGFEQLTAWMTHRTILPPGPLLCVIDGTTRGRRWSTSAARCGLRHDDAGVRRRFAPHQLRTPTPSSSQEKA
jgi:hypothetical protein